jgi:hypothetical protein
MSKYFTVTNFLFRCPKCGHENRPAAQKLKTVKLYLPAVHSFDTKWSELQCMNQHSSASCRQAGCGGAGAGVLISATEAVFPFGDSAERFGEWQHRFGRAKIGSAQSLLV